MMIEFIKMHGLGNDFVIIDGRQQNIDSLVDIRVICDRHFGIGCDQLIILKKPNDSARADVKMDIYNNDGTEAKACGNAARCVGYLISKEVNGPRVVIEVGQRYLVATNMPDGLIDVNMGSAQTGWQDIPLTQEIPVQTADIEISALPIDIEGLNRPYAVNVGNPHAIYMVDEQIIDTLNIADFAQTTQGNPLFSEGVNVGFLAKMSSGEADLKLRVYERGAGETLACGSGACAAFYIANKLGLCDQRAKIRLSGGQLMMYMEKDDIHMCGAVCTVFKGHLYNG